MTNAVKNRLQARVADARTRKKHSPACIHETHIAHKKRAGKKHLVLAFVISVACMFFAHAFGLELAAKLAELTTGAAVYWVLFGVIE